jgi:hypothetical protein
LGEDAHLHSGALDALQREEETRRHGRRSVSAPRTNRERLGFGGEENWGRAGWGKFWRFLRIPLGGGREQDIYVSIILLKLLEKKASRSLWGLEISTLIGEEEKKSLNRNTI